MDGRAPAVFDVNPAGVYTGRGRGAATALQFLEVRDDKVKYVGPGDDDSQAASVRSNQPVPSGSGVYYYEVEIINKGRDGYISVGFSAEDVALNRLVGWEARSYGYHGDDGNAFEGSGRGKKFGPTFTSGDVIGALLNQVDRTIAYFKNGVEIGVAFRDVSIDRLYPAIGMRTPGEEVRANFGARPFMADVAGVVADVRRRVLSEAASVSVPAPPPGAPSLATSIVLRYLIHAGYADTAQAVARTVLESGAGLAPHDMRQMELRRSVRARVMAGDLQGAVGLVRDTSPEIIEASPKLRFQLYLLRYLEMVGAGDLEGGLAFAKAELVPCADRSDPAQLKQLQEALALQAYEDPSQSPLSHLLHPSSRSAVAECLHEALLRHQGLPPLPELEAIYRQTVACHGEARRLGCAAAALVDPEAVVLHGVVPAAKEGKDKEGDGGESDDVVDDVMG